MTGSIRQRPWEKEQPIWLVWRPENGDEEDDARRVMASDAEQAAEDYAERDDSDSAEYGIVGGSPATVCVRAEAGGEVETFVVSGEAVPHYSARKTP